MLMLRHTGITTIEQRFGERKLQHDLAVVIGHLDRRIQQPLVGAFAAQQFQDHGARHLPGAIGIAQLFAFRVSNQLIADPRVEVISGHEWKQTFGWNSTGGASQGIYWMMGTTPSPVRFDITLLYRSG